MNQLDTLIDADMTRQLSIIENNFETLISQISILFEKIDNSLVSHINNEFDKVSDLVKISIDERLDAYKAKIEASLYIFFKIFKSEKSVFLVNIYLSLLTMAAPLSIE